MKSITQADMDKITRISKQFAAGLFGCGIDDIPINGSEWFCVDPLSAYLESIGYINECLEIPANDEHPQILILVFLGNHVFIPAGGDIPKKSIEMTNWMWIDYDVIQKYMWN